MAGKFPIRLLLPTTTSTETTSTQTAFPANTSTTPGTKSRHYSVLLSQGNAGKAAGTTKNLGSPATEDAAGTIRGPPLTRLLELGLVELHTQ